MSKELRCGRKVKLATLVDPETAQTLRDQAALHHLSLSQAAAELLAGAVKTDSTHGSAALYFAELRQTFHRDLARMANRLAYLLVRSAVEAGAARREVFNLLIRFGVPAEAAKQIHDAAWQSAMAALRKPVADLRDLADGASVSSDGSADAPLA